MNVVAPKECPHCSGIVRIVEEVSPAVHLQDDIAKKLGSSDDAFHAYETYWTLNGERAYYWDHCDARFCHFQFDTSRSGHVSCEVLCELFTGTTL